ncbi:cadherin domain-containing protein [Sphaerotilus sp.]|uniref:cadherin domain-containing protein n=1 Tax=Sphaerotilus sp. TaxID=2093942 RepID=UPI0034E24B98
MPPSAARVRSRALMEALEPRILYSADLAAVAALAGSGDVGWTQEQRLQTAAPVVHQTAVRTEIAFVDLGVPDARSLVDGLLAERAAGRPIEVVTIATDADGLAVIGRTLAERQAAGEVFDAVHVFSHGQAGVVRLGASTLDADSLLRRAGEIAGWGSALTAQADLMLYGCDVAAGASGLFLIEGLAALTGADVAASDNLTGSAARGGDWLLEQHTGQIEATVAVDAALQQHWDGVLGSETQINLTTTGDQNTNAETRGSQQAVTLDAAGNYTVVWTSSGQDGSGKGVYARRFAYDGTALTGEIQVNTTTANDQQNARIVGDSAGNFAVVWSSSNQDGTASSVYFRRFAADGSALTGEIRANATSTGAQSNAVLGMNTSNGALVVAWEGAGPTIGTVYFRRFAADGTALDATDRAASTVGGEADAAVAMDATGRFVVAWNRASHMYFQRFDASGTAAGGITQVDNSLSSSVGASIAMDSAGNFALAYTETRFLKGIWGRAYYADGSSHGTWFYADSASDATSPSISLAADGTAVVVYQKSGDGSSMGIYARVVNANGTFPSGSTAFLVNQTTLGDQLSASVAVHDASHYVVAWSGEGAVDTQGVSVRTFEPANAAPQITSNGGGAAAAVSVAENTTAVTTVQASDTDWPVQTPTYAITGGADQAAFAIDSQTGVLTFVVPPNFELPTDVGGDNVYNVVVSASDGLLASAQALSVTVTNVNDKVSARPDTVTTPYQTTTSMDVLANDLLGTGTTLTLLDLVQPAHGQATISAGQVVYTPDAGYVGSDTLQYRVIDGSEGLGGYWSLDDNIGSHAGEPSPVAGVHGQALQFNGVDDRLALAGVSYTNEFTLSYWFKLAGNSGIGYQQLYSDGVVGVQNSLNTYFIEDATLTGGGAQNVLRTVILDANDTANLAGLDISATGLADNQWHQYTLTTATGTGSSVYIDGVLRASSAQGGDALATNGNVLLGTDSTLSATRFLSGSLDDVALYDHTTPAASVAALASGPGDVGTVSIDVVPVNTQTPVITSGGGADAATVSLAENGTAVTVVTATDADVGGPALRYTIVGGADQALFSMDAASGAVAFLTAPDFEQPIDTGADNVYDLTVQVSDGLHVDTQQLRVVVTDANEYAIGPVTDANSGANVVGEDAAIGTVVGLTASAVDADATSNAVTYALTDNAGGRFAIGASSGVVTVAGALDAETALRHTIVVQATSADGSVSSQAFDIAVQDVNEYAIGPVTDANSGANVVGEDAAIGTAVGLTASAVDADATSNAVTYALTDNAGGRFAIGASSGVVTVAGALDAETALRHTIVVQATSADGSVSSQAFDIAVQDVNEFSVTVPIDANSAANAVNDNAAVGTLVGITASARDADAAQNQVTYALADDAGGRFAIDAGTGVVTLVRSVLADGGNTLNLVLQATSADGSVATQALAVAVNSTNLSAPVIQSDGGGDTAVLAVQENASGAVTTVVATDADVSGAPLSYQIVGGADAARFTLDAATGVLRFVATPDAELPLDAGADNRYDLIVQASDGVRFDTQALSVVVLDVNEMAVSAVTDVNPAADTVQENAAIGTVVGVQARAVDGDATNSTVTYSLDDTAGGRFAIDARSGVVTVAGLLDAETAQSHTIVVRAASSDGSATTLALAIAVQDLNEYGVSTITDADAQANSVREDDPVGTAVGLTARAQDLDVTTNVVTYSLADDAGGRFAIDATTGVVTIAQALDAETAQSHSVVVRALSADGSVQLQAFSIAVRDVDEFDLVAISDLDAAPDSVAESAAIGTGVGITAQSIDADVTNNTVTYTLDDSAGGRFAVDAATGVVTLARAVQDEGVATRTVVLRATSADGSTVAASFAIAILPVNGHAPVIDSDGGGASAALAVDEGQTAVTQVLAHDDDLPADTLRYAISGGADATRFTLDAATGVLRFAAAPDAESPLDQGADNVYDVTVQVSDGLHTDEQALRITVQPLNDTAPVITSDGGGATALRHVDENTLAVTQVQARDADLPADTLTYAVSGGADAALFTVDAATGALRWRAAPDRETPRDAGADGVYDVTVSVSDGLHTVSQSLAVLVDNVDEAPRLDINTLAILEGGTARPVLVASDVDSPAAALVYTVLDLTGGRFEQTTVPGVAVTRFTQAEVDIGAIRFVADGNEAAPGYRLALADATTVLAPQAAQVAFTPVNDAPVTTAVDLGAVDEDSARVITAADLLVGASDAEGDALSVSNLRLTGGEGTLVDLGGGRWRFDPAVDWHGAVTLAGEVSDGQARVALGASLQVRAVNDAPHIVSGGGAATVALDLAENLAEVTTVVGTDVDADVPLRYAVVGGADAARFQIDAATGVLSFRQAPDHERPTDANGDNRYDVTVEVSDGALTAQQALQITVTNVDEAPVVTRNTVLVTDGAVTLVLQASDQDTPATALTYRVDSVQGGQFEQVAAPGKAVTAFTQADLDAARVTWVAAPAGGTAAAFALRLSDGHSEVRIGSPTQQHQAAAAAVEMTVAAVAAGDTRAASAAGDSAATATAAAAPVGAVARRVDPGLPLSPDTSGDGALGPGLHATVDTGPARGGGVRSEAVDAPVIHSPVARAAAAVAELPVDVVLELPSEGADAPKRLVNDADLWGSRSATSLAQQMDRLREEVADAQQAGMVSLASTALVSTGLSVGYVIWLVRGGVLMTSLMSVVPAWAGMDPLPVLAEMRRHASGVVEKDGADADDDDGGNDPIERLFGKARSLLTRPAAGSLATHEPPEMSA